MPAVLSKKPAVRNDRLSIRVDRKRKAVIARAAKQQGVSISEFVLENAYQMARTLVSDDGKLDLTRKQVAEIFDALDNPKPEKVAAFRKLLNTRTILDG